MAQHVNPYVAGRPIDAPEGFYGREDVFGIVRDAVFGGVATNCLALFGGRRTGKTSVLKQLEQGRLGEEVVACLVNMEELGNVSDAEFLSRVATEIAAKLGMDAPAVREGPAANAIPEFSAFLNRAMEPLGDRKLMIMIDETEKLRDLVTRQTMSEHLLDYLCHLNEDRNNVVLLYTGSYALKIAQDPLLARLLARTTFHEISFLDRQTAMQLAREPAQGVLEYSPEALEELWRLAAGHPFFIQILCRMMFQTVTAEGRGLCGREDVVAAAAHVVANEPPHLHYVWQSELEAKERLVAAALADLRPGQGTTIGPRDAASRLRRGRAPLPISLVDAAVSNLALKKLVRRQGGSISFALGLYEDWLLQRHPLPATIHEERESLRGLVPLRSRPWSLPLAVAGMAALAALVYSVVSYQLARESDSGVGVTDLDPASNSIDAGPDPSETTDPNPPKDAERVKEPTSEHTWRRFGDLGFSIAVPPTWLETRAPGEGGTVTRVVFTPAPAEPEAKVIVELARGAPGYPQRAAKAQDLAFVHQHHDAYSRIVAIGAQAVDGATEDGARWEFTLDLSVARSTSGSQAPQPEGGKGRPTLLRKLILYCCRLDRGYNVVCQAPEEHWGKYAFDFEAVLRHLELCTMDDDAALIAGMDGGDAPRIRHAVRGMPTPKMRPYRSGELGWSMHVPERWAGTVERENRDDEGATAYLRTFRPRGGSRSAKIRVETTPGDHETPQAIQRRMASTIAKAYPDSYEEIAEGTGPTVRPVNGQSTAAFRWEFVLKHADGSAVHKVIVYCRREGVGYGVVFQAPHSAWGEYEDAFRESLSTLQLWAPEDAPWGNSD